MEVGDPQDGGCLAWAIVFASFMVSFLQVPTNFPFLQVFNFFLKIVEEGGELRERLSKCCNVVRN